MVDATVRADRAPTIVVGAHGPASTWGVSSMMSFSVVEFLQWAQRLCTSTLTPSFDFRWLLQV